MVNRSCGCCWHNCHHINRTLDHTETRLQWPGTEDVVVLVTLTLAECQSENKKLHWKLQTNTARAQTVEYTTGQGAINQCSRHFRRGKDTLQTQTHRDKIAMTRDWRRCRAGDTHLGRMSDGSENKKLHWKLQTNTARAQTVKYTTGQGAINQCSRHFRRGKDTLQTQTRRDKIAMTRDWRRCRAGDAHLGRMV